MATTAAPEQIRLSDLPPARGRAGIAGTLRSEYTKIRSVRSTFWTLLALAVVCIGLGALVSYGIGSHWNQASPSDRANFDATNTSLTSLYLGQLVIAVLGTLVITTEYSTGMMRTSLTAMPRRGTVFAAKAIVFGAIALVVGEIISFIMFFLGQSLLHSTGASVTLSDPGVTRAVVGGGLFLAVCGLFAFAIGSLIRHSAGAIAASIGILFVIPIIANALPSSWYADIQRWLPSMAGASIWSTKNQAHMFGHWTEFLIFAIYTLALLTIGLILFRTRDA